MEHLRDYHATETLSDGGEIVVRAIRSTDGPALRDAVSHGDPATLFLRFQSARRHLSDAEVQYLTDLDFDRHVGLVAELAGLPVAVARYVRTEEDSAEAAIVVHPESRNRGVATLLLTHLGVAARSQGVQSLTGQILAENRPMLDVIKRMGIRLSGTIQAGVIDVYIPLA